MLLMFEGNLAPAHVNVADPESFPGHFWIPGTGEIGRGRRLISAETDTIFGLGDIIYESVLEDGADPAAVLEGFTTFFEQGARRLVRRQ